MNQTGDAKDDYFSDGLADELIRVLSRIDGLRVTARSVAFRFKGQPWDARQVGRELGDGLALGEGYFGYVAGVLGHTVEARSVIGELQARRQRDYSPALPIAWTYLGLGETASALEWLETALAEQEPYLGSAMVFPGYDAIRDQARFRRLAQQLKLSTLRKRPSANHAHRYFRPGTTAARSANKKHALNACLPGWCAADFVYPRASFGYLRGLEVLA